MARHKSALVALKNLEKSYEQHRRALLRKAEDEMSATVERLVGELAGIAKDFPAVVSKAVAPLALSASTAPARKRQRRRRRRLRQLQPMGMRGNGSGPWA